MRILFAAGGTAGHINPAIAVAEYMSRNRNDVYCLFSAVPGGMEEGLAAKAGFKTTPIRIYGIQRRLSIENIRRIFCIPRALHRANKIIEEFRPDVVFATGGYLSYPIVTCAARKNIPCILHESNAIPGFSVKLLARKARHILLNYEETKAFFSRHQSVLCVGTPLRTSFNHEHRTHARRELGIEDGTTYILSFGGSLGAERLNTACADAICKLSTDLPHITWHHATGRNKYEEATAYWNRLKLPMSCRYRLFPYFDDMSRRMAAADVVISRAGAITLAELAALGKASILIPYPKAANDHQTKNAQALETSGAAILLPDADMSGEILKKALFDLISKQEKRHQIEKNIRGFHNPDCLENISKIIENCL